jgi:parallel beta-helix repeat protein
VTQVRIGAASAPGRSRGRVAAALGVALIAVSATVALPVGAHGASSGPVQVKPDLYPEQDDNIDYLYTPGTFYVDVSSPACTHHGPGTEAQPYCSISAALDEHGGAGTTLIVRPGVYRERVTISASGTSDNPLILRAAGSGVVIDGADDFSNPVQWVPFAGDVWVAAGVDWTPLQVFADGARLTAATGSPANLSPGTFRWVNNAGLCVNVGGGNPASHQIGVGRRKYGFVAYAEEWVTIEGFTVTRTENRGIYLSEDCANIRVLHNTVTFANRYGIQVTDGEAFVIGSNTVSDNNDHGISITNGVTGSLIEDNESFRNARPGIRAANGIYVSRSTGNTLRRNRLHDNQDSGLHFQDDAHDNVCTLNRSWNNGDHGYDHLGASGTIHVCDVAYGNYKDGFSIEGGSPGTQLYNCIATDNGLTTNEFDLWVDLESTPGFISNYNLFWNSTAQAPVKYISTLYPSVASYSAASGQDTQTLQADPRFVNPAAGDFHLNAGSPAIDNGNSSVPWWPATDVEGHARADDPARPDTGVGPIPYADRGALEYQPGESILAEAASAAPPSIPSPIDPDSAGPRVPGAAAPLRPVLIANPMRGRGGIGFATSRPGLLQADIFDASGRRVRRLAGRAEAPAGWHDLTIDGRSDSGATLAAGIYFYRIVSVDGVVTGRLVLLK